MMLRYRLSEQRREKMNPLWRSKERLVIPRPLINHGAKSRFPNALSKGRVKGKRLRKRTRTLRQTKGDIKKKHAQRSNRKIAIRIHVFHRYRYENTSALCYTIYMFAVRVRQATENVFDFIHNGRYAITEEISLFFLYAFQTNPTFLLIINHLCTFKCIVYARARRGI